MKSLVPKFLRKDKDKLSKGKSERTTDTRRRSSIDGGGPVFTITYSKFEDAGIKEYHVAAKCIKEVFPEFKVEKNQVGRFPLRVVITAELFTSDMSGTYRIWQGRQQDLMKTADKITKQKAIDEMTKKLNSFKRNLEQQQEQQRNNGGGGEPESSATNKSGGDVVVAGEEVEEPITTPNTFDYNNNNVPVPVPEPTAEQQQLPLQIPNTKRSSRMRHHEDDGGSLSHSLKAPTLKSVQ